MKPNKQYQEVIRYIENARGKLKLACKDSTFYEDEMYDILGSKVYAENGLFHSGTNAIHLNAEEFSQGIYTWNLRIGSDVLSGKIVVTK